MDIEKKRKICFVITSKIHYARNKLILEKLHEHTNVELQIVLGASALLERFGKVEDDLVRDGFTVTDRVSMLLEGSTPYIMAKSTGIGIMEFSSVFERIKPDIVIVRGDRYEMLAPATAAAYMNISIAHIEGGDTTGSIDESVRHAITKLSHIHFATNDISAGRIRSMGENPDYVFNVGSPELEVVASNDFKVTKEYVHSIGVGDIIDLDKPYIIVMQHSVTSEYAEAQLQIEETLKAVKKMSLPTIWFWPNVDAGSDLISKRIRQFRESTELHTVRFVKYLPQDQFYGLLKNARCLIGNSSAGLKECALLGVPVVNIGNRQGVRHAGKNVIAVSYKEEEIIKGVTTQLEHGQYEPDEFYHVPNTSLKIVSILTEIPLYYQKTFYEQDTKN